MNSLQKALLTNAVFSGVSGCVFIFLNKYLAILFGVTQSMVFWLVGLGLLFFTGTIVLEIKKQRRLPVLWIIVQDAMWVIGSLVLLIFQPFYISFTGKVIVAAIAVIVFLMMLNQYKALNRI